MTVIYTRGGQQAATYQPGTSAMRAPRVRPPEVLRAGEELDAAALRNKAQADPDGFVDLVRGLCDAKVSMIRGEAHRESVDERTARNFSFARMTPENFRAMKDALGDLEISAKDPLNRTRGVTTSAFPLLTSALAVVGVSEAYEAVETIGEELVTDVDDRKKQSAFAGVLSLTKDDHTRKNELEDYAQISAGEEAYHIGHLDQGLQVVIGQELLEEADLPNIAARLTMVGEIARELLEEQTLKRVTDHDGSAASGAEPYALHGPSSSAGQALFVAVNTALSRLPSTGNRITSNPLSDQANLEAARARLAGMTNSRGKRIVIPPSERVLLVPDALLLRAWSLLNSVGTPGVFNEANFFGPGGPARPRALLSSSKLDDLSSSAWYYGAPRRQFRRKWKLRPEVSTFAGNSTEAYTSRRQAMRVRIAWDVEIGAVDYVYWLQNLSGTTAPKDE